MKVDRNAQREVNEWLATRQQDADDEAAVWDEVMRYSLETLNRDYALQEEEPLDEIDEYDRYYTCPYADEELDVLYEQSFFLDR